MTGQMKKLTGKCPVTDCSYGIAAFCVIIIRFMLHTSFAGQRDTWVCG